MNEIEVYPIKEDNTLDFTQGITVKPNEIPEGYAIPDGAKQYNSDGTEITDAQKLESAISAKISELSNACKEHIVYGFVASNGNKYRLTLEDQMNMQGQKAQLDADTTITNVDWLTMDDVSVTHTRDEWLTVYSEAFTHKDNAIWKNKNQREQAKSCLSVAEVDTIVW